MRSKSSRHQHTHTLTDWSVILGAVMALAWVTYIFIMAIKPPDTFDVSAAVHGHDDYYYEQKVGVDGETGEAGDDGEFEVAERYANDTATEGSDARSLPRVAIVTMMHDPSGLRTWLNHHLGKGIHRFYVRYETCGDPAKNDMDIHALNMYPQVSLQIGKPVDPTEGAGEGMDTTPGQAQMLRQRRWLSDAIGLAQNDGVHWLIHIDSDELLDCAGGSSPCSVPEAIQREALENTQTMVLNNYEALYNKDKIGNTPAAKHCFSNTHMRFCSDGYCASYANGKGIGRVSPYLREDGVHRFRYDGPNSESMREVTMSSMHVVHFESCDFVKYVNKFMKLANEERVQFPFQYYNDSISIARTAECQGSVQSLVKEPMPTISNPYEDLTPDCKALFENTYKKYRVVEDFANH